MPDRARDRRPAPDVVVCGPASWNQIITLDELPAPVPHMQFARRDQETVGGTSAGKALHLADLGRPTALHTVLGTDPVADVLRSRLADAGVAVEAELSDGPSERHLNLMDPDGGRVSIYLSVPDAPEGGPSEALRNDLDRARAVVMDLSARSRALLETGHLAGLPVWTDLHDYDGTAEFHRPFLAAASYVFLSADGLADPLGFLHATVDGGAEVAVCTFGAEGAVAVDAGHTVHRVAAARVDEVVDTNGAGDAFMAGYLHAFLDGAPVEAALEAGARQATRALGTVHLSPLLD